MNPRGGTPSHNGLSSSGKTIRAKELENELFVIRLRPHIWRALGGVPVSLLLNNLLVFTLSLHLPLDFTDGSTLLHQWSKQSGGDS